MDLIIILKLLLAHFLTDFVFQTDKWVENKRKRIFKSFYFWVHIFLSGFFTYILLQQWTNWEIPLFILITHGLIDYFKIKFEKKNASNDKSETTYFFADQFFHILIIFIAWLMLVKNLDSVISFMFVFTSDQNNLLVLTSMIFLIWPTGIAIDKFTSQFRKEFNSPDSLNNAGKYIGIFERLLVFIFIMNGQYSAIGFLIAGKSILRISSDKETDGQKQTEYVLIGTLVSFTVAITTGLAFNYFVKK